MNLHLQSRVDTLNINFKMIQDGREKSQNISLMIFSCVLCCVSHPSIILMSPLSADPTNVSFDERRMASGFRESKLPKLSMYSFSRTN